MSAGFASVQSTQTLTDYNKDGDYSLKHDETRCGTGRILWLTWHDLAVFIDRKGTYLKSRPTRDTNGGSLPRTGS